MSQEIKKKTMKKITLNIKHAITEMKSSVNEFNNSLDTIEETVGDLEDRPEEIICMYILKIHL